MKTKRLTSSERLKLLEQVKGRAQFETCNHTNHSSGLIESWSQCGFCREYGPPHKKACPWAKLNADDRLKAQPEASGEGQ